MNDRPIGRDTHNEENQYPMDDISVSVPILGRTYKLTVAADEEKFIRAAAERINSIAKIYGKNFSYNDHQDLLAMVSLSQITELTKIQENLKFKDKELIDKLTDLDAVLEKYLHPTQNSL